MKQRPRAGLLVPACVIERQQKGGAQRCSALLTDPTVRVQPTFI